MCASIERRQPVRVRKNKILSLIEQRQLILSSFLAKASAFFAYNFQCSGFFITFCQFHITGSAQSSHAALAKELIAAADMIINAPITLILVCLNCAQQDELLL
jgi:hypothetical protein